MYVRVFAALVSVAAVAAPLAPASAQTEPARATAAPTPAAQSYVLGADDVIEVDVLGRQDFRTRARIRADGVVLLPLIGSVQAANKTPIQLSEDVAAALTRGGYFSKPIVTVDIVSYASRYVTVLGAVASSGLVPVDRAYRVSEILARVGGAKENAADYVVLTRANGQDMRLKIADLATGGEAQDPYVQPGDKLYAPQAELIYVTGQVNAPGAYPMASDMTLRMAIARGGGVSASGTERRVKVTRNGRPAPVGLDDKIQPGDVIAVGERLF
jgi:polysaccharide export outer membrane protein